MTPYDDDDPAATAKKGKFPDRCNPLVKIRATERGIRAVEMRIAGYTYQDIADTLRYSDRGAAHNAVTTALNRWGSERVHELRALELARLDAITQKLWPLIERESPDLEAVKVYLRVSERRARLCGLDAAQGLQVSADDGQTAHIQSLEDYEKLKALAGEIINVTPSTDSNQEPMS